jgi:hypothetical protein
MPKTVTILPCKTRIEFDNGSFDQWCVYVCEPYKPRYAPKDSLYFGILKEMGHLYGSKRVYDDFVKVYKQTGAQINPDVVELILNLAEGYGNDKQKISLWFTVLYAGMVAEENKERAILKKRIKRLGLHQVLIENAEIAFAAGFSRGKSWKELDEICKMKGF